MLFADKNNCDGTINVLLLGSMAMLSVVWLLHLSAVTLRQVEHTWQQLNDDAPPQALLCPLPLRALLQENVAREALRLPMVAPRVCLLPATDYGNRWQDSTRLNVMLCAVLDYIDINDFDAWGRTCD